ncbi:MAG: hypothetical protein ACI8QS_000665 [Planctomycetota bacterium]|jgi:hypothetical protein
MKCDCETLRPSLGAYMDGELPEAEAAVVDLHLGECAACVAELAALRGASEEMRTLFHGVLEQAPKFDPVPETGPAPKTNSRANREAPVDTRPMGPWAFAFLVAASLCAILLWGWGRGEDFSEERVVLQLALTEYLQGSEAGFSSATGVSCSESIFEPAGTRFLWGACKLLDSIEPGDAQGGSNGEYTWYRGHWDQPILVTGTEAANWLPASMDVEWPLGFGPSGVKLLRDLEQGEFEVASVRGVRGETHLIVHPRQVTTWEEAQVDLDDKGRWLNIEFRHGQETTSLSPLNAEGEAIARLLSFSPAGLEDVFAEGISEERIRSAEADFESWTRAVSTELLDQLQGLGYAGGGD